jgi:hypothetical protein
VEHDFLKLKHRSLLILANEPLDILSQFEAFIRTRGGDHHFDPSKT